MIKPRYFNEDGINRFIEFIENSKENKDTPKPNLNTDLYSTEFINDQLIDDDRIFESRMDLGSYLYEYIDSNRLNKTKIEKNYNFWTWISYIWFDQLCPIVNGKRKINEIFRYICIGSWKKYYRHLVASSYRLYTLHDDKYSQIFLHTKVYTHNDYIEQLASRQDFISNTKFIKLVHKLYWDEKKMKPKVGSSDRKRKGSLRRLLTITSQLELTYDIKNLEPEELMNLLPPEFYIWKDLENE
ncbi:MAG: hypothetical protein ISS28_06425 [Candidatus Cloacimonetes bacterium]|nr:hypothetical protein [Candidatus Cloacimonadota bacterium]